MSQPAFDLHVMVDWSAAGRPVVGRDSIWAVVGAVTDAGSVAIDRLDSVSLDVAVNLSTRDAAERWLWEVLSSGVRVLVGIDVPLGVPAGLMSRIATGTESDATAWSRWWNLLAELITDGADNVNNRWAVGAALNALIGDDEGPFWGCPPRVGLDGLHPTRPRLTSVNWWRHVEDRLRQRGLRPFSLFQLAYAGSVGSQALMAVPRLARLRERLACCSTPCSVWPFEAIPAGTAHVVVAEIWPSALQLDYSAHPIRDAAQVIGAVQRTVAADRCGLLGPWMANGWSTASDGSLLSDSTLDAVVDEEGWVLGIDADGRPWTGVS
jgi:precorrin-8X/cobalt-precorrin-8 methylmutase